MTLDELLPLFRYNMSNIARALEIERTTVSRWKIKGRIPYSKQCELELYLKGQLKAKKDE